MFGLKMVEISHQILGEHIKKGDVVLDATIGNGYDTLFLCETVGSKGKVFGFDILQSAIDQTYQLLNQNNLLKPALLVKMSHQYIKAVVTERIHGFIFNLGYLPGGDKSIVTKAESTIPALSDALDLLLPGGIGIVIVYYGHMTGKEEAMAVNDFLKALDTKNYEILRLDNHNRVNAPPILYMIKKQ